jgi:hypothetical protein
MTLSARTLERIDDLWTEGLDAQQIADRIGIRRSSVLQALREMAQDAPDDHSGVRCPTCPLRAPCLDCVPAAHLFPRLGDT